MYFSFLSVRISSGLQLFALLGLGLILAVERVGAQADLAVTVTGPASAVYTNDLIFYGVNVVNLGPNNASNVMNFTRQPIAPVVPMKK